MASYLVTGGAGFIGSNLVERLLELGESVRVVDNLSTGRRENIAPWIDDIDFIEGDLRDAMVCAKAVRDVDYVLHQAALPSVPRSIEDPVGTSELNLFSTIQLLNAAAKADVRRVVYAASSSAYGDQPVEVKHEGLMPEPMSPYACAKLAGEHYCAAFTRSFGLSTVAIRYFNVFGPRQDPNSAYSAVIPLFVTAILNGKPPTVYGDGKQTRDFTFVRNVVNANMLAATCENEDANGQVVNVACGGSFSLLDLIVQINAVLGTKIEPEFAPARVGDVMHSLADIARAKELLGYEVEVDFAEGLDRTINYYKMQMAQTVS